MTLRIGFDNGLYKFIKILFAIGMIPIEGCIQVPDSRCIGNKAGMKCLVFSSRIQFVVRTGIVYPLV